MAAYLVTFELADPRRTQRLIAELRQMSWTQLGPAAYAVMTDETDEELFFRLRELVENGESLYVVLLRKPYRGMGFREVNHWLEQNLRW
ncbi:hypothetical protein [Ancylobacter amanitiformis]|uniref:Uncharacterized protein n=1 Tax=Ancylobacter amanitiformis TaxID=217069 RepID=A0ABU0LRJ6_9HYPH|nr:hypothetical protein [Ancylobacter amanitiformis]MDQ0511314.1 hypothetical protein [Ancylobacter amanitiformis]